MSLAEDYLAEPDQYEDPDRIPNTTAIYPNRLQDKQEVEAHLHLPEIGNDSTRFYIHGIDKPIAIGYVRVVYGDHGPYVEFRKEHFRIELKGKYNFVPDQLPDTRSFPHFYIWLHPDGMPNVKVYWQVKDVKGLPNAPARPDGRPSRFSRKEGYADYRRGRYYISTSEFTHCK